MTGRAGSRPKPARNCLRRRRWADEVDEGMPDILGAHAGFREERLLEGEDAQREVDGPPDVAQSAAAPGPDLRRDEVDDAQPERVRRFGEAQVEVRRVDEQDDRRPPAREFASEPAQQGEDRPELREDLRDADERELFDAGDLPLAGVGEAGAADPPR